MRNKRGSSFSLNGLVCSVFLAVFVLQGGLFAQGSCTDAAEIGDETVNGSTQGAPRSGDSDCGRSDNSPSNWYKFTAKANGSVTVRTCGSGYDTVLSVYSGCPGEEDNELSCNDDTCGLQSEVEFSATDGEEYLVRVAGYRGATGDYTLEVSSGGGGPGPGDISGKFRTGSVPTCEEVLVRVFEFSRCHLRHGVEDLLQVSVFCPAGVLAEIVTESLQDGRLDPAAVLRSPDRRYSSSTAGMPPRIINLHKSSHQ